MKKVKLHIITFFIITNLFFIGTIAFSLSINIVRPFQNLTQNDDLDWLNIALPQMVYDTIFPLNNVRFSDNSGDVKISGKFSRIKGGIVLIINILRKSGNQDISSIVIGNPYDPLSTRDIIATFISQKFSLGDVSFPKYPRDALMAYYRGVYYKYIGEETYGNASYPSQAPWKLAINYFREALKVAPDFKEAYRELALSFRRTKWYAEEVKAWSFYMNLATPYEKKKVGGFVSDAYFNLAYSFYRKGRKDVALSYLLEAVEYNPKNLKAHYWLGRLYYDIGKLRDAEKEWGFVVSVDPNYKSVKYFSEKVKKALKYGKETYDYFEKGYLAYKRGEIDLAVDYINKAMELNYKFMDTYYWLARIEIERKRYSEALKYLKQGLEVNPSDKKILYLIKVVKSKLNNRK